jgi:hypothetical protein
MWKRGARTEPVLVCMSGGVLGACGKGVTRSAKCNGESRWGCRVRPPAPKLPQISPNCPNLGECPLHPPRIPPGLSATMHALTIPNPKPHTCRSPPSPTCMGGVEPQSWHPCGGTQIVSLHAGGAGKGCHPCTSLGAKVGMRACIQRCCPCMHALGCPPLAITLEPWWITRGCHLRIQGSFVQPC